MQELSSVDQRHLENQTEEETNFKKQAQNRPSVWKLMTSVFKVLWKFCTTTYDIASDFLQGKQALLLVFPKLSASSLKLAPF